ncbi:MAG TPA: N-acetylmuramoyl-L-alanine amidase [Phaeodactylibacter sp.]|nr:N-acetylmuramoyl-L-alanine amidase [Phaeodactylibacter sp.]
MLQKIIDFFRRLFSFSSGSKKETSSTPIPPVEIPTTEDALPEIVDVEQPQDGADVLPDEPEVEVVEANITEPPIIVTPEPSSSNPTEVPTEVPTAPTTNNNTSTNPEPSATSTPSHSPRYLWILDNGHGKKTKGKRSPKWDDGKRLFEYELNRGIVKKIMKSLDKKGVKYHNLVPEENVGNILKKRVARANTIHVKSDLPTVYISIHSNAGPEDQPDNWSSAEGIETWYYRPSTNGKKIAKIFQKHLISKTGWVNREVRTGMNFYVIKYTSMPAILTENGFFNNKKQGRQLLTDAIRQKIADAHVDAIMEIEKYGFDGHLG